MSAASGNRLVIANSAAELRRMSQWLAERAAASGIPHELLFPLEHSANEAVVNIISHAYDDTGPHDISLELDKTENGARLVIRDDGRPFNILEAPDRVPYTSLAEAAIGGLGIHLIRGLMSRCDYRREDGNNVLILEAERELQPGDA
jgi:serine/threonine-protein kinase RsbW